MKREVVSAARWNQDVRLWSSRWGRLGGRLFLAAAIVVVTAALLFVIAYAGPNVNSRLKPPAEARPYCHANSGASGYVYLNNSAWVQHFENNGAPRAGHELDFFTAEGDTDCNGVVDPTAEPTAEPTATPTNDVREPTDEPTPTSEVTEVEPSATPTASATGEVPPTATTTQEESSPTPTVIPDSEPTAIPRECPQKPKPCGWNWHLVGPQGQTAWFVSFSLRPGGDPYKGEGWYPPSTGAQLLCLGWIQVSNLPGRPYYGKEPLVSCQGGSCR